MITNSNVRHHKPRPLRHQNQAGLPDQKPGEAWVRGYEISNINTDSDGMQHTRAKLYMLNFHSFQISNNSVNRHNYYIIVVRQTAACPSASLIQAHFVKIFEGCGIKSEGRASYTGHVYLYFALYTILQITGPSSHTLMMWL